MTSTRQHLVDTDDVERMGLTRMWKESLLDIGDVLVAANTSGFESFRGELLVLLEDRWQQNSSTGGATAEDSANQTGSALPARCVRGPRLRVFPIFPLSLSPPASLSRRILSPSSLRAAAASSRSNFATVTGRAIGRRGMASEVNGSHASGGSDFK